MGRQARYRSYLLRVWRVEDEPETRCRCSLECTATGERHGFASLDELMAFLSAETDETISQELARLPEW